MKILNKIVHKGESNMKDYYQVIPESVIRESADVCNEIGEYDNNFSLLLSTAAQFKTANMTPIFLLDPQHMDMLCVAKETFGKKLH